MNNTIYIFAWGNNLKRARLKGRACKLIATGALNSCEVMFTDTLEHEIVSRRALRAIKCRECGESLIEIDFNTSYCVRLCDNFHCALCGERQGLRERSEEEGKAFRQRRQTKIVMRYSSGQGIKEVNPDRREANDRRKARPGYRPWLEKKKENYHKLRALGYSCKDAIDNTSKKRMVELGIGVN